MDKSKWEASLLNVSIQKKDFILVCIFDVASLVEHGLSYKGI